MMTGETVFHRVPVPVLLPWRNPKGDAMKSVPTHPHPILETIEDPLPLL